MSTRVLFSCDMDSVHLAAEELRRVPGIAHPGEWIDTGDAAQGSILLTEVEDSLAELSARLESIFVRHLAPVQFEVPLTGTDADLAAIVDRLPEIGARLDPQRSFSVQARILGTGKLPYRKVVVNETVSNELEARYGAPLDCRWPEQVVSILCRPDRAYIGVSPTSQNRSAWPGGKHRFKRDDDQVSRAEFKLLEAMSVFDFEFPTQGEALDIGAAPGGWSRVLATQGLRVDAVDPADLDPRLRGNRNIRHHRRRIQDYAPGTKSFAVIVNDMKMDARDSIEHMLRFADRLQPDGCGVITLKLPRPGASPTEARRVLEMVAEDLERLSAGFQVVGARQLYHNRSEVTVLLASLKAGTL